MAKDEKYSRFLPGINSDLDLAQSTAWSPNILADANGQALQVQIYHIPTKQKVEFAAFLTEFSDSFTSNWEQSEVLGRMDPIMNFKNTQRNISLAWDVPAASFSEARTNMAEINKLIQFLYPTYSTSGNARTMNGSPLVKIQFQNLIVSGRGASTGNGYRDVNAKEYGLISAITSCTALPDLEAGFFSAWNEIQTELYRPDDPTEAIDVSPDGKGQFPKLWRVNLAFTALHDHLPGNTFNGAKGFPYYTETQKELRNMAAKTESLMESVDTPSDPPDPESTEAKVKAAEESGYKSAGGLPLGTNPTESND